MAQQCPRCVGKGEGRSGRGRGKERFEHFFATTGTVDLIDRGPVVPRYFAAGYRGRCPLHACGHRWLLLTRTRCVHSPASEPRSAGLCARHSGRPGVLTHDPFLRTPRCVVGGTCPARTGLLFEVYVCPEKLGEDRLGVRQVEKMGAHSGVHWLLGRPACAMRTDRCAWKWRATGLPSFLVACCFFLRLLPKHSVRFLALCLPQPETTPCCNPWSPSAA